jgi:ATP-dependent Clp protease ATP-binding subunit ClpX
VNAANGDISKAERGIVYIDEIDKCSRKGESASTSADPSHEDLQQGLLKFVEGTVVEVAAKGQRHHPNAETFKFNTENVLFIVGGAFEGIEKIIAKRQKKTSGSTLGFGTTIQLDEEKAFNDLILDIKAEDLRKYGMLPELLGRFPVICSLQTLSEEALTKILTEPKNSLVKQYKNIFRANAATLTFTDEALRKIANKAIEMKTGARSLRGIVENILMDTMYKMPDFKGSKEIIVDVDPNTNEIIVKDNFDELAVG